MDISGNKIEQQGLELILKMGLLENRSVVNLDVRLNPGTTPKYLKNFALGMLRNIEIMREKQIEIPKQWLNPLLYGY